SWLAERGFAAVIVGPAQFNGTPYRIYSVHRINIQATTYDEEFQVVDVNQIKIHFEVHFLMRPDVTRIKDLVEKYGGGDWYHDVAKQTLRTFVRDAIGL